MPKAAKASRVGRTPLKACESPKAIKVIEGFLMDSNNYEPTLEGLPSELPEYPTSAVREPILGHHDEPVHDKEERGFRKR